MPIKTQEVREDHCTFGPDAKLWEILGLPARFDFCRHQDCPEHLPSAGSHHDGDAVFCRPCISCSHNSLYSRRILFRPGGRQRRSDSGAAELTSSPFRQFKIEWPLHPQLDSLQWIGGTYAAHPWFFLVSSCQPFGFVSTCCRLP